MSIFTVISFNDSQAEELQNKVRALYKDNCYIPYNKKDMILIRCSNGETASEISNKLGMGQEEKIIGMIIKHETWYGYADVALWDWCSKDAS